MADIEAIETPGHYEATDPKAEVKTMTWKEMHVDLAKADPEKYRAEYYSAKWTWIAG
jgi:hypothetical protein